MMSFEQALSVVRGAEGIPADYRSAMVALGAEAAGRLLEAPGADIPRSIHLLVGIEDHDGFGKGFAERVRQSGVDVTVATHWTVPEVLVHVPWLETARIAMSHCDRTPDRNALLVAATAVLSGVAVTSYRLMDALYHVPFRRIHVAAALGHEHAERMLRIEMTSEQSRAATVSMLDLDPSLSPLNHPEAGDGLRHLNRMGHASWKSVAGFLPEGMLAGAWPKNG